jgi:protein-disulfide isomerase
MQAARIRRVSRIGVAVGPLFALALLASGCDSPPGDDHVAAGPIPAGAEGRVAAAGNLPPGTLDPRLTGYREGSPAARATVIEFSDPGCPFCAMFHRGTFPRLREEYVETGRVLWVHVPVAMTGARHGEAAARASVCAGEEGSFGEWMDLVYAGQNEWRAVRNPRGVFAAYAERVGLDDGRFATCIRENRGAGPIRTNLRVARELGVRATPSYLVEGRLVEGSLPLDSFRRLLDRTLDLAD